MNIGILVDNLNASDKNYFMIREANKASSKDSIYCFYHNLSNTVIPPNFATMGVSEAQYFSDPKGLLISTSFDTLTTLCQIITPARKYHYMWDLEWLRSPHDYMGQINQLKQVNGIICRSDEHSRAIFNYCNIDSIINRKWDFKCLRKL